MRTLPFTTTSLPSLSRPFPTRYSTAKPALRAFSSGPEPGGMALRMAQRTGGMAMKKRIMPRETVSVRACSSPSAPF